MVAADHAGRVASDPVNAGHRVGGIVHNIAQKQTCVEFFIDRCESGPVGMNVGKQKNSHGAGGFQIAAVWLESIEKGGRNGSTVADAGSVRHVADAASIGG